MTMGWRNAFSHCFPSFWLRLEPRRRYADWVFKTYLTSWVFPGLNFLVLLPHFNLSIIIIWEANHPFSQLRAELRRARLQPVREAGMQGRLWQPDTNPLGPRSKHFLYIERVWFFPRGGGPDGLENPRCTAENQRTTQLTYGPGRVSNRGHLGERRALYAQSNNAYHM